MFEKIKLQNYTNRMTRCFSAFLMSMTFFASGAYADDSEGEVLLKIIGSDGAIERFTRDRLDGLEQYEFTTSTLWTTGESKYSGPSLKSVLDAADVEEGRLELTGVNGYSLIMDTSEDPIGEDYPIIATTIDDKEFEVWEKGPLWIIYNFDEFPSGLRERANALSVWQLVDIREFQDDEAKVTVDVTKKQF